MSISGILQAQDLNKLLNNAKKRAAKKVEQRANKLVDQAVDKAVDKAEKKVTQKVVEKKAKKKAEYTTQSKANEETKETQSTEVQANNNSDDASDEALLNLFNKFSDTKDLKYNDSYGFSAEARYKIDSYKKNGSLENSFYYRTLLDDKTKNAAIKIEDAQGHAQEGKNGGMFVFDVANNVFIMLSEKEKNGFVMGTSGDEHFDQSDFIPEEDKEVDENVEKLSDLGMHYKKTGRSKKIMGYTCYEYYAKENEIENHAWTTKDVHFDTGTSLSRLNAFSNSYSGGAYPPGFLMELESINTDNGEKQVIKLDKFDEHTNQTISLKGYKLAKIGSNFGR